MTNGDTAAARLGLDRPSYESVAAACRWATRHHHGGRSLFAVSESDRALRVVFSQSTHRHEALRAAHDLGYAARAGDDLSLVVTGWDTELLAQRTERAGVELRAVQLARREVASTALTRAREHLAAGIDADAAVARAGAGLDTDNPQPGRSDAADARPAWTAAPITPTEIGTASSTMRAQLGNLAAAEQAILIQHTTSPAQIARSAARLFLEYRDRHGYDERDAVAHAFADVAAGIDSAHELTWAATSPGEKSAPATAGQPPSAGAGAGWQQPGPASPRLPAAALQQALIDLAGVFGDTMTAVDVGGHMTCTEADAIARALLAGGHRVAASRWLAGHARGDDDLEVDRHHGDSFDLDAYLDGLHPQGMITDRDPREEAPSPARDEPAERGVPASAPPDLEQWAHVVRELAGSAVVEDPAWHYLGHAIDRAHGQAGMCTKVCPG
jgi:hypothetical protein